MILPLRYSPENKNLLATPPRYETAGASGFDLRADIEGPILITPRELAIKIPTGVYVAVPAGYELQVRSRSGLALNCGIIVANTPGTVDADYRGEVKVGLVNIGQEPFLIHPGDRIAQAVICPVIQADFAFVDVLDETARGEAGFGSTGVQ